MINVPMRNDYSMLFSNMNSSTRGNNSFSGVNLTDYASIRNGSYGKLLKSYYKQSANNNSNSTTTTNKTNDVQAKVDAMNKSDLKKVQTLSQDLQASANKLMQPGVNSVFNKENMTTTDKNGNTSTSNTYNSSKIYDAVSSFAKSYNALIDKSSASSSASILKGTMSMAQTMNTYADPLKEMGITIGADNKLSVNKDTFLASDMSKAKSLFQGNTSLTAQIATKANAMGNTAYNTMSQGNLYTNNGGYSFLPGGNTFNNFM